MYKRQVYESAAIAELFLEKNVLVLEADETGTSEYTAMLKNLRGELGARSIPFMALFSGDDPYQPAVAHSIVSRGQMAEMLNALPNRKALPETAQQSHGAQE